MCEEEHGNNSDPVLIEPAVGVKRSVESADGTWAAGGTKWKKHGMAEPGILQVFVSLHCFKALVLISCPARFIRNTRRFLMSTQSSNKAELLGIRRRSRRRRSRKIRPEIPG